MMSSSPSDLSFLSSVLSSSPADGLGMDTTFSFTTSDTDFNDMMMSSPFMNMKNDYNSMNIMNISQMTTHTSLPQMIPIMNNLSPLSPDSDNGSFAESVMSVHSSQQQQQQQQSHSISMISENEYHTPNTTNNNNNNNNNEPLSPLPEDYFTNMALLQAQAQQQAQHVQQQQQQQQQVQQQTTTLQVPKQQQQPSILYTSPPTTPNNDEKKTLLNHLSVSITPSVSTTTSTSTSPIETKKEKDTSLSTTTTKKRKSRTSTSSKDKDTTTSTKQPKVKVESPKSSSHDEDIDDDDDIDIVIDPNLPPDVIRELLQEQSLKKKRLARKAELARMSRKRKKTRMGDLELENERLLNEIDRLRKMRRLDMEEAANKQQQAVAAATAAANAGNQQNQQNNSNNNNNNNNMIKEEEGRFIFDSRRWIDVSDHQKTVSDAIQAMADAARTVQGQEDTTYMNKLHETFVQSHNRQMIAGEGHIVALENHLSPSMPLQFLQWVMSQPDKFVTDTSGLWNSLFQAEIGVSIEQMKEIMALRTTVKKQRKVSVDVEKAYKKLAYCLRRQMLQSNENLTKLRSILSPLQLAKYFDWVNRFGHVCVKINL